MVEQRWDQGSDWAGLRGRVMLRGRALTDDEIASICRRPGRLTARVHEAYGAAEAPSPGTEQEGAAVGRVTRSHRT